VTLETAQLNPFASLFLDDLIVGQEWLTRGRTITESDVVMFANWSGDNHPLHTDEEFARQSQFGGRIFHGPGALAIAFGLEMSIGWKTQSAIAFLSIKDWTMKAPVKIGDTLRVREEVVEVRPSESKPDRGVVTTRVQILNQHGHVVQEGLWLVLIARRSAPDA
jgi:acyl dehydratase